MIRSTVFRLACAGLGAALVSGCALLSSPDPVQTYRFGASSAAPSATAANAPVHVALRRIEFPQATEGDKILGVTGTQTAYIKGARWISDARDLYTASLESAFSAQSSRVRLIGMRETATAARALALDVRAFEARYPAPGAAPTVVVTVRARMLALPSRGVSAERVFTVERRATANRVSAIVEAFDSATRDVNAEIVTWADASVG